MDTSTQKVVVEAIKLTKIYGSNHVAQVHALDGVSFRIHAGEFVAVMGPSGSGKSTLLNMLGALDKPSSGQVIINGQDMGKLRNLDRFRARTVGFVFQLHNLIPTLTAAENVEVPMQGQGLRGRARRKRAQELLEMVGMDGRTHHLPSQLSGGQRQKVAIARALANNPTLVLADEPTGNLDSVSGDEVMKVLETLNSQHGATIMLVTHDPSVARRTHRILMMQDGRLVDEDIVGDTYTEDLKVLARSDLGKALLSGEGLELLSPPEREVMHRLIERVTGAA
ncbi:MAG: ABC transporter ATP-binding protein [Thermoflexales bacterium]|nr:ABC transporter ATP-binding protein [Thermoflexales bacterium]